MADVDLTFPPEKAAEYQRLAHAMQSGVAFDQARGSNDGSPKHLRVGVNCAMVETAALARMLVEKGVCTAAEYHDAVLTEMRSEVERYEARLSQLGPNIKLA